ncbi:MAG: hypothetical protein Q8P11_03910 [bacterium]|nr:hypothetical protein [bacterium]
MDYFPHIPLIPRIKAVAVRTNKTALGLIILLGLVAIGAIFVINGKQPVSMNDTMTIQPSLKTLLKNANTIANPPIYYALLSGQDGGDVPKDKTSIYLLNTALDKPDTLVVEHNGWLHFYDTNKIEHTWLASVTNSLYIIKPDEKKIDTVITAPDGFVIDSAKFSHDTKKIAYTITNERMQDDMVTDFVKAGELYIYDINSKEATKIMSRTDLGVYEPDTQSSRTELLVDAWTADDTKIIGSMQTSGLSGVIDGERFYVELTDNNIVKKIDITPVGHRLASLYNGIVSNDGRYIAYHFCPSFDYGHDPYIDLVCPKGEEIMLADTMTGQAKSVYQNSDFADILDSHILRNIYSIYWIDDATLAFSTTSGIFQTGISREKATLLYPFEWKYDPTKSLIDRPSISAIFGENVIITTPETAVTALQGHALINLTTKKLFALPPTVASDSLLLQFLSY